LCEADYINKARRDTNNMSYTTLTKRGDTTEQTTSKSKARRTRKTHNSRGIRTPEAADSLRSYDDYLLLRSYFMGQRHGLRNHMLMVGGCTTGLRISDLVSLKFKDIFEDDNVTFKRSINIVEQKTGKSTLSLDDEVLITEAFQRAIVEYLDSRFWQFNREGWLFWSQKPVSYGPLKGEHVLTEESCHRIMKDAERALNLPINLGSHTFRKTFTTVLVQVVANSNSEKLRKLVDGIALGQIALRHNDIKTTMRYIKHTQGLMFGVRHKISDFFLGKTKFKSLVINYDDIFEEEEDE
jgi:integrase